MRRLTVKWMVLITMVASMLAVPAGAEGNFSISGKVTDHAGTPLSNVYVRTSSQIAFTGEDGRYRFEFFYPGSYRLEFMRNDMYSENRTLSVDPLNPHATQDVNMTYWIRTNLSSYSIDTTPADIQVQGQTYAPADSCMTFERYATTEVFPMTLSGSDEFGLNHFNGVHNVAAGAEPGLQRLLLRARDCDSGVQLALGSTSFRINTPPTPDITPPAVDIIVPASERISFQDLDVASSPDGSTQVLVAVDFVVSATDDRQVASVRFELYRMTGELVWFCDAYRLSGTRYSCSGLIFTGISRWEFRAIATDSSMNRTTASRVFEANGGPLERDRLVEL